MFEQLGGRKFVFLAVISVVFGALTAFKVISVEELKNILLWAYGIFVAGNTIQKLK